jgi:hypothetical protein
MEGTDLGAGRPLWFITIPRCSDGGSDWSVL